MSESLNIPNTNDRWIIYREIIPQIKAIISNEIDLIANQANIVAALKEAFSFFWVGFYWVKENELVLGPFQGPIACTRIAFNRGVCGKAYTTRKSILVPNVNEFPNHIACSSTTKSELVVPIISHQTGEVLGVLDVDSDQLNNFSEVDVLALEELMRIFENTVI